MEPRGGVPGGRRQVLRVHPQSAVAATVRVGWAGLGLGRHPSRVSRCRRVPGPAMHMRPSAGAMTETCHAHAGTEPRRFGRLRQCRCPSTAVPSTPISPRCPRTPAQAPTTSERVGSLVGTSLPRCGLGKGPRRLAQSPPPGEPSLTWRVCSGMGLMSSRRQAPTVQHGIPAASSYLIEHSFADAHMRPLCFLFASPPVSPQALFDGWAAPRFRRVSGSAGLDAGRSLRCGRHPADHLQPGDAHELRVGH